MNLSDQQDNINIGDVQRKRKIYLALVIAGSLIALLFVASGYENEHLRNAIKNTGIVLIAIGIGGRVWSIFYIGGRKSQIVVDKGPYSVTRNPLYVFSTIAAGGVGALGGSLVLLLLYALGCWLAFHIVILQEEKYLAVELGRPYLDYKERVPRFLPRFSLFEDLPELNIDPKRIYVTLGDALVFYLAVPYFLVVDYLQHSGVVPVLLRLP